MVMVMVLLYLIQFDLLIGIPLSSPLGRRHRLFEGLLEDAKSLQEESDVELCIHDFLRFLDPLLKTIILAATEAEVPGQTALPLHSSLAQAVLAVRSLAFFLNIYQFLSDLNRGFTSDQECD